MIEGLATKWGEEGAHKWEAGLSIVGKLFSPSANPRVALPTLALQYRCCQLISGSREPYGWGGSHQLEPEGLAQAGGDNLLVCLKSSDFMSSAIKWDRPNPHVPFL